MTNKHDERGEVVLGDTILKMISAIILGTIIGHYTNSIWVAGLSSIAIYWLSL